MDLLDLPGLLDQVIELDLMTWRALLVVSMDVLASEDQMEYRVLLDYLDFQVTLACPADQVRRVMEVLLEEMGNQAWMASLDLRGQKVTEETQERGVNQVEMELDYPVHQVHLDHQDKSSTRHQAILMKSLAELALRVGLVYLVELDFLVQWGQKVTEEILVLQAMVRRVKKGSQAWLLALMEIF